MPDIPARLAERLRSEGQKTLEFFQDLKSSQWDQQLYTEGSCWSIRLVLAHFVSSEASFFKLFENVLAGGQGAPEGFDIDAYNERKVDQLREMTPTDLLNRFAELRQESAMLVARMSPEDLSRTGRHPFLGVTRLEDMIKLLYRHNQIHLRDIRKVLVSDPGGVESLLK